MPLDPRLLAILACPVCKTAVTQTRDGAALRCESCRRLYAIGDDFTNFLVEEATVEPEGSGDS